MNLEKSGLGAAASLGRGQMALGGGGGCPPKEAQTASLNVLQCAAQVMKMLCTAIEDVCVRNEVHTFTLKSHRCGLTKILNIKNTCNTS